MQDRYLAELFDTPEKKAKLYLLIQLAHIIATGLIAVGGLIFILTLLGVI